MNPWKAHANALTFDRPELPVLAQSDAAVIGGSFGWEKEILIEP